MRRATPAYRAILAADVPAVSRMVEMNGDTLITRDSGGGWSWNFTAYGDHYGNCGSHDMFTVADLFDEAIGVSVLTQ